MEGAIVLLILLLIGVLILPIILASGTNSRVKDISQHILRLESMIRELNQQLKSVKFQAPPNEQKPFETVQPEIPAIKEEVFTIVPEPVVVPEPEPEIIIPVIPEPIEEEKKSSVIPEEIILPVSASIHEDVSAPKEEHIPETIIPQNIPTQAAPASSATRPDLERFIGQKLMSFVGIGILVLGIFFTVKWAIDKQMIGDAGKVLIGILSGTLLIGMAHKIRKSYHAFSSILVGGGLAVLYFSVYIAFQDYHLLSQTPAFIAMVFVTICAVALSLLYNRIELAVIALVGGFATPFFVSNNEGNYQVLFSYLLVLNVGMFILANYKKWNLINIIGYIFTILIFTGWLQTKFDPAKGQAEGAFLFATLFYLVFFAMNVVYNIRNNTKFKAIEIGMLLSNTFLYFGVGLYVLKFLQEGYYNGIFTIALAVFNFAFAYIFYKKERIDKNLIYLLIGLVLTFVSLTAPIQLHGNYITLFWAAEMVLLYWLGQKSGIQLIRNTSLIVLALALVSLVMDWIHIYEGVSSESLPIMINRGFITGVVVVIALLLKKKLAHQDDQKFIAGSIPTGNYAAILKLIKVACIYLLFLLELSYQLSSRIGTASFTYMIIWLYHYLFAMIIFIYARKENVLIQKICAGILVLLSILYIGAAIFISRLQFSTLTGLANPNLFLWHYLIPVIALGNVYLLIRFVHKNEGIKSDFSKIAPWFFTIVILFILSNEILRIWTAIGYRPGMQLYAYHNQAIKIAFPILWSICSFVLMLIGMKLQLKTYRIISISLFTLTILKLFIYDISDVSQGGKIAAFVILGIILLVVSFLYQKIKGLFVDDDNSTNIDVENKNNETSI